MSRDHPRQLVRAALAIQRQLEGRQPLRRLSELPSAALERAQRLLEHARLAEARGWRAASAVCRDRLRRALDELKRQVEASLEELQSLSPTPPTLRDRYRPRMEMGEAAFCCVDSISARSDLAVGRRGAPVLGGRADAGRGAAGAHRQR